MLTPYFQTTPWLIYRHQLGFLNLFHPEIRAHTLLGERADEREHLVGEAPDVQDVMAVLRLCGGVGLDVQADEFGFGAALFQDVPFFHQAGFAAPLSEVCPAFVIRHDDDQIHISTKNTKNLAGRGGGRL